MKVIYFQVKETSTKLKKIVSTAQERFSSKHSLLILAPNASAMDFIDRLLFRTPPESFLPHHAGRETTEEPIAITDQLFNTNQATALFNLTLDPIPATFKIDLIYELEDLTSDEAHQAFKKKFTSYRALGAHILTG